MVVKVAYVFFSRSIDPWYNLAVEEWLLRRVEPGQVILYLWQNHHTVVIGRNQNAWKECRCQELEASGGKLARRLSGGGAVYHDLGNLNFTFLAGRDVYDVERQLQVILDAVRSVGIEAEFSGRNDLEVSGRKFSGNAFYLERQAAFHHGTVMVNCDFTKLSRFLQVSSAKMAAKGVESLRARVINLAELNPTLTVAAVQQRIVEHFAAAYSNFQGEIPLLPQGGEFDRLVAKYSSWQWRYGQTPQFAVTFETRFPWGGSVLALNLRQGRICEAKIFSDAMDADLVEAMATSLLGVPFTQSAMAQAVADVATDSNSAASIVSDVSDWISCLVL